jgi:hypothetical protein
MRSREERPSRSLLRPRAAPGRARRVDRAFVAAHTAGFDERVLVNRQAVALRASSALSRGPMGGHSETRTPAGKRHYAV